MLPYEQLDVYKKAYHVNQKIYRMLKSNKSIASFAKNQLGRASLSIVLNIAEGSAKLSTKDRRNFFAIARGSVFESSSLICFLYDEGEISEVVKEDICTTFDEISKILYVMVKNLEVQ